MAMAVLAARSSSSTWKRKAGNSENKNKSKNDKEKDKTTPTQKSRRRGHSAFGSRSRHTNNDKSRDTTKKRSRQVVLSTDRLVVMITCTSVNVALIFLVLVGIMDVNHYNHHNNIHHDPNQKQMPCKQQYHMFVNSFQQQQHCCYRRTSTHRIISIIGNGANDSMVTRMRTSTPPTTRRRRRRRSMSLMTTLPSEPVDPPSDLSPTTPNDGSSNVQSQSSTSSLTDEVSSSSSLQWEPTDVNRDLLLLRRGIQFGRRKLDLELKALDRVEEMDYMASSNRRPLIPDVQKYVMLPMAVAWVLYKLMTKIGGDAAGPESSIVTKSIQRLIRLISLCSDFHFWIMIVIVPSLMYLTDRTTTFWKERKEQRRHRDSTRTFLKVNKEHRLLVDIDDFNEEHYPLPRQSVSFLMEYWWSAVTGVVAAPVLPYIFLAGRKMIRWLRSLLIQSSSLTSTASAASWGILVMAWLRFVQLLTRMAVMASVHQYPKKLFEVERKGQPRPIGFTLFSCRFLLRSLFVTAPLGLSMDLYKVLSLLPQTMVMPMYGSVALILYGTWNRMNWMKLEAIEDEENKNNFVRLPPRPPLVRTTYAIANFFLWRKQLNIWGVAVAKFVTNSTVYRWWALLIIAALAALPLVPPMAHLKFIGDIMHIEHTHNISVTELSRRTEDQIEQCTQWRYRLDWREPQRLKKTLDKYKDNILYWWFVKDGQYDRTEEFKKRAKREEKFLREHFQRLDREYLMLGHEPNRDLWKPKAMEKLRQIHEREYQSKNNTLTFDDPLGVALQQTLDIGLHIGFDYKKPLKPGVRPSLRRLHSRAIQSAIRRIIDLKKSNVSEDDIEKEKSFLAKELTELVPPHYACKGEEDNMFPEDERIAKFFPKLKRRRGFWKKVSHYEARFIEIPDDESSPSTEQSPYVPASFSFEYESPEYTEEMKEELTRQIEEDMRAAKTPYPKNMLTGNKKSDENDENEGDEEDKDKWEPEIYYC